MAIYTSIYTRTISGYQDQDFTLNENSDSAHASRVSMPGFLKCSGCRKTGRRKTVRKDPAIEKITIRLDFIPDVGEGKNTFGVCARCHLPEAWGTTDGTYPQLAGQHVNVLMKQLLDIRNGSRHSSLMFPFVQARTIGGYQELSNVVAYISTLPMNPEHAKGPWRQGTEEYRQGQDIYQQHCSACHGAQGEGNNDLVYPRLQGQHFRYMSQQLSRIKSGLRKVHPAMQAVVENLDLEQLDKAINYTSYFAVPKEDMAASRSWRNPDFK